ncbi:HAD-IA family hydrolase [Streptomyces sp. SPB162]|uniref:HAD-IA family hydrolase n=1 Tax=Streptomyces sp. SPB162 TaxID=2940560 RepID=UPI002406EB3F|nr:HAD-IA family hydrolase [Streptomyces sp. SPB162]MDF9810772.1 putative hydrolase of the HAD superfamily [Streptomyces sp. SPB162]
MTWLIFDFAGVIGQHQPQEDQSALLSAAGGPAGAAFWQAYWDHREGYDAGSFEAQDYWSAVLADCGKTLTPHALDRLIALDVASWIHPNRETIALLDALALRGTNMALLSNCPRELAATLDKVSWLGHLSRKFYSSRLAMVKPNAEIYLTVTRLLGTEPTECVFVDDRPANVAGAEQVDMRGIEFTNTNSLRQRLIELDIL